VIARICWSQDGTSHESTCSGLADSQDGATAILARAGYEGSHVPAIVVSPAEFSPHKPGQILGFANASSWWPALTDDWEPTHLILHEGRILDVMEADGALYARQEAITCESCAWSLDASDDRNLLHRGQPAPDAMIAAIVKPMRHNTPALMDDAFREVRLRAIRKEVVLWERATVDRSQQAAKMQRIRGLQDMALAILRVQGASQ
jgi:hypothetical protein